VARRVFLCTVLVILVDNAYDPLFSLPGVNYRPFRPIGARLAKTGIGCASSNSLVKNICYFHNSMT